MNIKILGIVFVTLLLAVILIQVRDSRKGDKSDILDEVQLEQVDTNKVTRIKVTDYKEPGKTISIAITNNGWQVSEGNKSFTADPVFVKNMLENLASMKLERIAATRKENWAKYNVDDSSGVYVQVMESDKVVAELIIGRFSYKQISNQSYNPYMNQTPEISTFIRKKDDQAVLLVKGMMSMIFNNLDIDRIRDKKLVNVSPGNIKRIHFQYPGDSSYSLVKNNEHWSINGTKTDSLKTQQYIKKVANLRNFDLADDDKKLLNDSPKYIVKIEGDNFNPIDIKAYPADTIHKYIITSSSNLGTYFSSKNKLFDQIFVSSKYLIDKK
ncbi:MAG: DUF4340 domain-containing protein [bacterium]